MLEIITHAPNAHELRRDGVRVAVVDDFADARKLAAVDELLEGCKLMLEFFDRWGDKYLNVPFGAEYFMLKNVIESTKVK